MRIKSYFVKTVEEAMAQARKELGPDALLLNTRRLIEGGKSSGFEVVMGVAESAAPPAEPLKTAAGSPVLPRMEVPVAAPPAKVEPPVKAVQPAPRVVAPVVRTVVAKAPEAAPEGLADELKKLRTQMDEIQQMLLRSTRTQLSGRAVPELNDVYANLLAAQVDPVLSKDIVDRLEADMATDAFFLDSGIRNDRNKPTGANRWKVLRAEPERLEKFLRTELERRIHFEPKLGSASGSLRPVTILVGPTGGGKTTTVAKLAVIANEQTSVQVLSLDRSRPGASQQLQSLAVGPKIQFQTVDSLERLPEQLDEARKHDCVLVDTAGFSAVAWRSAEALAATLAKCPELDVQLVVPAYMNAADFRGVLERYSIFRPSKLLITKMDEAQSMGTAFSEAVHAELALSFLTNGPRVPDDIHPATVEDLVALAQGRSGPRTQRAA